MIKTILLNLKKMIEQLFFTTEINQVDISSWFLEGVIPRLETLYEEEENENIKTNIQKMIECFKEANKDTSSKQNGYREALNILTHKVHRKYGEDFSIEHDDELEIIGYGSSIKEYKELLSEYNELEKELTIYRNEKLLEGLSLFEKYFWSLK